MSNSESSLAQGITLFDDRPFFEKAIQYGVNHNILSPEKLEDICNEAPKGMVQIARYFGSEFLRADLEQAKTRIVNLVSLYLEHSTGGDLRMAAESLRDHSLLSRSKAGADMLRSLFSMPTSTKITIDSDWNSKDLNDPANTDFENNSLIITTDQYKLELSKRLYCVQALEAAYFYASTLGMSIYRLKKAINDVKNYNDAEVFEYDAESVIRTAIFTYICDEKEIPDIVSFEKMIEKIRKNFYRLKYSNKAFKYIIKEDAKIAPPQEVIKTIEKIKTIIKNLFSENPPPKPPDSIKKIYENIKKDIENDIPKFLQKENNKKAQYLNNPKFKEDYFTILNINNEIYREESKISKKWQNLTEGRTEDCYLLTLCLLIAAGSAPKIKLTQKSAATLVRKIRKTGLNPNLAKEFIDTYAPSVVKKSFLKTWNTFLEEAQPVLESDRDYTIRDALRLISDQCIVTPNPKKS